MPLDIDEWEALHLSFCQILRELNITFKVVPKEMTDIGERVKLALSLVECVDMIQRFSREQYCKHQTKELSIIGRAMVNEVDWNLICVDKLVVAVHSCFTDDASKASTSHCY